MEPILFDIIKVYKPVKKSEMWRDNSRIETRVARRPQKGPCRDGGIRS